MCIRDSHTVAAHQQVEIAVRVFYAGGLCTIIFLKSKGAKPCAHRAYHRYLALFRRKVRQHTAGHGRGAAPQKIINACLLYTSDNRLHAELEKETEQFDILWDETDKYVPPQGAEPLEDLMTRVHAMPVSYTHLSS